MTILFDIFIKNPERANEVSFEENKVLEVIFDFVESRVKILQVQIEGEEERELSKKDKHPIGIVIELKKKRVSFVGYSDDLIEKLKDCFTPQDGFILGNLLAKAFDYLN